MKDSETLNLNNLYSNTNKKIYKFGFGGSPFSPPRDFKEQVCKSIDMHKYLSTQGLEKLRESISNFYNKRFNWSCYNKESIVIGPGTKELLFLLQFHFKGRFIIPTPAWVSYLNQSRILNNKPYFLRSSLKSGYKIDLARLEKILMKDPKTKKCLVMINPSNPTGATYESSELRDLGLLLSKYKTFVISDEIYWMLQYNGKNDSIARYYPERSIISSGISKWAGAGGYRLGYFIFGKDTLDIRDVLVNYGSETYSCAPTPIQYSSVDLYTNYNEKYKEYNTSCNKILRLVSEYCYVKFNKNKIRCPRPGGGFYLFLDFNYYKKKLHSRGITNSVLLCSKLLSEYSVSILAGKYFGIPEKSLAARFAFVDFDGDNALKNISDLNFDTYFKNIIDGVNLIVAYVRQL